MSRRSSGVEGTLDTATGHISVLSELVFPPFCFVLCFDSPPPDPRLVDITWFGQFGYTDWKHIDLPVPALPIVTAYPGDYRDRDAVRREAEASGV